MLHCDQRGGFQGQTESLCLFPFPLSSASLLKTDSSSCPTPPPHPPACFHQPGHFKEGPFLGGPDTSEHLSLGACSEELPVSWGHGLMPVASGCDHVGPAASPACSLQGVH